MDRDARVGVSLRGLHERVVHDVAPVVGHGDPPGEEEKVEGECATEDRGERADEAHATMGSRETMP